MVEAIECTLPSGGGAAGSLIGGMMSNAGGGNTLSTANLDLNNPVSDESGAQFRYEDHLVKELAFDLGVDMNVLKRQLMALFSNKL